MGYPVITWTPRDGSAPVTVSWAGIATTVSSLQGGPSGDRSQSFTGGGRAFTLIRDVYREYQVEMQGIRPSRNAAWRTFFTALQGWWEHALAGGESSLAMDSAKVGNTTVGAIAQGDTVIDGCASTAAFTAGEKVYFEDANDATKHAIGFINTKDSGTQVTLYDALCRPFSAGSVMRSYEYLPAFVCLESKFPLRERPGGKGADMWDLAMNIRSVR